MSNRSDTQKAFREIYSVERTMEGAARFLGYYEVFSKYQVKEVHQVHIVSLVRYCLSDRNPELRNFGAIEWRLRHFKRTGRLSRLKNY
ncbi:TPA: hypothetical protein ACOJRH_004976 [Vibrio harveyi]|uniref:hypothetical protein n=1 Tax=Vibrio harveyi TaxID=669 RepID=UPI0009BB9468|nr:hypothetical protein [Vibrio harveyi]HDM8214581.1 hypothetical protein [Vibrio harveyi]